MIPNNRKCIIATAQGWFDESRKAQKEGHMSEALLYMENALGALMGAVRDFPRAAPAPGGASTVHSFPIDAGTVWGLDRVLKLIDPVVSPQADREKAQ